MPRLFLFLCVLALLSCTSQPSESTGAGAGTGAKSTLVIPADEASAEERAEIESALREIESVAAELSAPRDFHRLPVIVTTAENFTDHPAACVSENGEGRFILLKPSVIEQEKEERKSGRHSALLRVLLHEIGHCYFGREHETAQIQSPGYVIEIESAAGPIYYHSLDVSVMVKESLVIPTPLERYYVAELLGLTRAESLADIAAFAPLKYLPIEKPALRADKAL